MEEKVLIVGLDGLDPGFFDRNKERFPVLSGLVSNGSAGKLRSTVPPFSLTAWPSAMSGINPAKTGVICFPEKDFVDQSIDYTSQSVEVPRMWDIAGFNKKKVGIINVPLTYPPPPVNGFLISGFLTPGPDREFTFPRDLKSQLAPGYQTSFNFLQHEAAPKYFLENLYRLTEKQFQTVESMIKENPWDLFIYVVSGTDWIQHYFCKDPDLPGAGEAEEIMVKYFQYVDQFLGRLMKIVDSSTSVIIISDHGFGKVPSRYIYLNTWLEEMGHLSFNNSRFGANRNIWIDKLRSLGRFSLAGTLKKMIPARLKSRLLNYTRLSADQIDWENTRATFSVFMSHTGYIRILPDAVSDAEYEQFRDKLIEELNRLNTRNPDDPIFTRILRREEIYSGPYLSKFPDILLLFAPRWLGQEIKGDSLFRDIPLGGRPNATHEMNGFFAISGPDIIGDKNIDLDIVDIAPTVYHLLGIPIPKDCDGRIVKEIFRPGSISASRELSYRVYDYEKESGFEWDSEAREKVIGRLGALGYL